MSETSILTYPIASGDMRYMVEGLRTLYIENTNENNFVLFGNLPEANDTSKVDLAQVLLEFAMAWDVPDDQARSHQEMEGFGRFVGKTIAEQIKHQLPHNSVPQWADVGIQSILHSMNVPYTATQTPQELSYSFGKCPLCISAECTGMVGEVAMAHQAFMSLLQVMVNSLDPAVQFCPGEATEAQHSFHLKIPTS